MEVLVVPVKRMQKYLCSLKLPLRCVFWISSEHHPLKGQPLSDNLISAIANSELENIYQIFAVNMSNSIILKETVKDASN